MKYLFSIIIVFFTFYSCNNQFSREESQLKFIEKSKNFNFQQFNNMTFKLWENKNGNRFNVFICREIESCDSCRYRYLFKDENLKEYEIVNNTSCIPDYNTDIELIRQFIKLDIRELRVEESNVFVNTLNHENFYLAKIITDNYKNSNGKFEEHIFDDWYRRVEK